MLPEMNLKRRRISLNNFDSLEEYGEAIVSSLKTAKRLSNGSLTKEEHDNICNLGYKFFLYNALQQFTKKGATINDIKSGLSHFMMGAFRTYIPETHDHLVFRLGRSLYQYLIRSQIIKKKRFSKHVDMSDEWHVSDMLVCTVPNIEMVEIPDNSTTQKCEKRLDNWHSSKAFNKLYELIGQLDSSGLLTDVLMNHIPYAEICKKYSLHSEGAVKTRMFRYKQRIRDMTTKDDLETMTKSLEIPESAIARRECAIPISLCDMFTNGTPYTIKKYKTEKNGRK